jgi:Cu/Ag efflux pump CusA
LEQRTGSCPSPRNGLVSSVVTLRPTWNCFALIGAVLFAIVVAPVLAIFLFRNGAKEWQNPIMMWLTRHYRTAVRAVILHRNITVGISTLLFAIGVYLTVGRPIGSEFLPHLDEGAIWVRGTLPPQREPHLFHRLHQQGPPRHGLLP